jgi:hypothetical protein
VNKNGALILIFFSCTVQSLYENYVQQSNILVYTDNNIVAEKIDQMLAQLNLKYQHIQTLDTTNDSCLYLIAGDVTHFHQFIMPKHYIFYQVDPITAKIFSRESLNILSQAKTVWDSSQQNINKYKRTIQHYSYLPNDPNYEFLDPALLPCFLPLETLDGYKQMLQYRNINRNDISDHIPALYCHCIMQNPSIIVEAGIRWGDGSTVPLKLVNTLTQSYLIGLDVSDCSHIYSSIANSRFLLMSDLDFPHYFETMQLNSDTVDFVFIDTTHLFDHTIKEIAAFISILSQDGILGFHDTNPVGNDPRGVIDALKAYFNLKYDESKYFNHIIEKDNIRWNVIHYPYNNGMTIMKRLKKNS